MSRFQHDSNTNELGTPGGRRSRGAGHLFAFPVLKSFNVRELLPLEHWFNGSGQCSCRLRRSVALPAVLVLLFVAACAAPTNAQLIDICPEQRHIAVRDPDQLGTLGIAGAEVPFTVALEEDRLAEPLSLDDAIQIAIQNAEVVRVLNGVSASSTGRTIYDVAISNASIDEQLAVFDPTLNLQSTMNKSDSPAAIFDPLDPTAAILTGSSTDSINTTLNLQKRTHNGATVGFNANAIGSYFEPGVFPLEPQYRSFAEITLRQPFARGYGRDANLTPVIVARINTERSFFQFKNSVQELVRSVIAGYWNLVSAESKYGLENNRSNRQNLPTKEPRLVKKPTLLWPPMWLRPVRRWPISEQA